MLLGMAEGARIYQRPRTPVNVPLMRPSAAPPRVDVLQVARPEGLEPPTRGLEGRCSIQLSYGRFCSHLNAVLLLRKKLGE